MARPGGSDLFEVLLPAVHVRGVRAAGTSGVGPTPAGGHRLGVHRQPAASSGRACPPWLATLPGPAPPDGGRPRWRRTGCGEAGRERPLAADQAIVAPREARTATKAGCRLHMELRGFRWDPRGTRSICAHDRASACRAAARARPQKNWQASPRVGLGKWPETRIPVLAISKSGTRRSRPGRGPDP